MRIIYFIFLLVFTFSCGSESDVVISPTQVVDEDTRVQVPKTTINPYRMMGMLKFKRGGSSSYMCTGTLIGPRHVLTAAHCLKSGDSWASDIYFIPGKNGSSEPYGKVSYKRALIPTEYERSRNINYDYGLVVLNKDIGRDLGYMEFDVYSLNSTKLNIAGYPGDKPYGTMWRNFCSVESKNNLIIHVCDTTGGMSGAALYKYSDSTKSRTILGIHGGTYGSKNRGVAITPEVNEILSKWISEN